MKTAQTALKRACGNRAEKFDLAAQHRMAALAVPARVARDPKLQHDVDAQDPFACSLTRLADLVESAGADKFLRGWLSGILATRQQLQLLIGI